MIWWVLAGFGDLDGFGDLAGFGDLTVLGFLRFCRGNSLDC